MFKTTIRSILFIHCLLIGNSLYGYSDEEMAQSKAVADAWLKIVDAGDYGKSWDESSVLMKVTIQRGEWVKVLNSMRKHLGSVISRKLDKQAPAENPKGLPAGEYMAILYDTQFSGEASAKELVTLFEEKPQQWKVMTYFVK